MNRRELETMVKFHPEETAALYDKMLAAIEYRERLAGMTNLQLADLIIEGPWANTDLFTETSELLEEIAERLMNGEKPR